METPEETPAVLPTTPSWKPKSPKKGETLEALATKINESYVTLTFDHLGQEFSLDLRRVTEAEMEEARAMTNGIAPPIKDETAQTVEEKYDLGNEEYHKKLAGGREKQLAILLNYAVKGGIPGSTVEERASWIKAKLPEPVARLITEKVAAISTTDVISLAVFT